MIVLRRRHLGAMLLGAGLAGMRPLRANSVPPAQKLGFIITRKNCEIGTHELTFAQAGDELVVQIDVKMRVGLGPFTLFRYHHQGEERWRDGRFISLQTRTDNDGVPLQVNAQRTGEQIRIVATNQAPQDLPGTALPLTHWNVACMRTKLFNPQDGTVLQETSQPCGSEMVALANGNRVEATRYALAGKDAVEDWYDDKQVWTALRATVKDGSIVHYTRQT